MEEVLSIHSEPDEFFLYFWKSEPAVVMGKNQVLWKEVHIPYCGENNIAIARRITGGGTVYHDVGNLNYSFIIPRKGYKESDYLQVVVRALQRLGISCSVSQKNSLVIAGGKIGGTAFRYFREKVLHHGTLLLQANLTHLHKSLRPSVECFSRGIPSRPAPVCNLRDYYPEITETTIFDALREEFFPAGVHAEPFENTEEIIRSEIYSTTRRRLSSWEWIVGEAPETTLRFPLADSQAELRLTISKGKISSLEAPPEIMTILSPVLIGKFFSKKELKQYLGIMMSEKVPLLETIIQQTI